MKNRDLHRQAWRYPWTLGASLLAICTLALASGAFFVFSDNSASALTTVPTKMNFQGRLTDTTGNIKANGTYNMKLRVYDAASAGTLKYSEDRLVSAGTGITLTNGLFSLKIGEGSNKTGTFDATIFASGSVYLEVELATPASATTSSPVWTEGAMTPRNELLTSAYAYNSETLDGLDSAAFAQLGVNNTFTGNAVFNGTIQGGSSATLGTTSVAGSLIVSDGSNNTATVTVGDLAGNYSYSIPVTTANDTFCLQGLANCGGGDVYLANVNTFSNTNTIAKTSTTAFRIQSDASAATLLTADTTAMKITVNGDLELTAGKTITIAGDTTTNRPSSPAEGMVYYDTTTKKLEVYSNGKWQADRTDAVLVAASNSSQADKDAADYVADGDNISGAGTIDGDQVQINQALTAASGKKVVLLAGTYVADATILVPNNTTLSGVGNGTVVELGNLDTAENLIENSDRATGAGVTIRDLKLDGRSDLNTAGTQHGIYLQDLGDVSPLREGGLVQHVYATRFSASGFDFSGIANSIIEGSTAIGNTDGFSLANGSTQNNRFSNNIATSNSGDGFWILQGDYNTFTGNVSANNTSEGFSLFNSASNNTFTGNTISKNGSKAISISGLSNSNIFSSNILNDNGGASFNNAIIISDSDSNIITDNSISDSSATVNNYAINLQDALSDANYLSDNTLGTGSINDLGTGTIYGGQVDVSGNYVVQPAGTIQLMKNTTIQGGTATLGTSTVAGSLVISDGSSNTATITVGALSGNFSYALPVTTANDTFCLQNLANCGGVSLSAANTFTNDTTVAKTSTTAFRIQSDAGAATLLTADTSNMNITINGSFDQTGTKLSLKSSLAASTASVFPREVDVVGNYAYVINQATGGPFTIVDITNPASPVTVGTVSNAVLNGGRDVRVAGNYAYVVTNGARLVTIDISNPSSPTITGSVLNTTTLNNAHGLDIQGKYAYVAAMNTNNVDGYLSVVDISNPASPTIVASLLHANFSDGKQIDVSGKYAYFGSGAGSGGLTVVDISNPLSPSITGNAQSSALLSLARDVVYNGKYVYMVGASDDSFVVIDVSNPASPTIVGSLVDSVNMDEPYDISLNGRYAYVASATSSNVAVLDISNPASPTVVSGSGYTATNLNPTATFFSGRYLYVASNYNSSVASTFHVLDTSGASLTAANINTIKTHTIQVDGSADIANELNIGDSLFVGMGGMKTDGNLTVTGNIQTAGSLTVGNTSTAAFKIQNASAVDVLTVDTVNSQLVVRGNVASDIAMLGSELFTDSFNAAAGWASVSGTGQAATATHTSGGGATPIATTFVPASGSLYQVSFQLNGNTTATNTVTLNMGSQATPAIGATGTNTHTVVVDTTSSSALSFTPTSNFNGTISGVSVKLISKMQQILTIQGSSGAASLEVRGSNTNLFLGANSGRANTGTLNTATGANSLQNNTTGSSNTATGANSLQNNTTGFSNTATGANSLQNNTTGFSNTASGTSSLAANTTGASNTAIGGFSLNYNTTGYYNTAIGKSSLNYNTTGFGNTAIGIDSLKSNSTGSYNSALGLSAGFQDSNTRFQTSATIQRSTAIGAYAQVQKNNTIALGSVDNVTQVVVGATQLTGTDLFGVTPLHYQTGTVTRTNGSATLTGTSTVWTSAMVGDTILFEDGTTNTITGFTNATTITMSTSYAGTTDPIPVYYRFHYPGTKVSSTGTLSVQGTSANAFQVQNAIGTNMFNINSTNNTLTVGVADTTGVQLVLDTKTDTGDPTGVAGGMYYSSFYRKFRCYESGAWKNCTGGNPVNSSTATQAVTAGTDTYLNGSAVPLPTGGLHGPIGSGQNGSKITWKVTMSKTNAGTAASTFNIRIGTAISTLDTARCGALSTGTATAAADGAVVYITAYATAGGTVSTLNCSMTLNHQLPATGFANTPVVQVYGTQTSFDSSTAGTVAGLSFSAGTASVITVQNVEVSTQNF